MTLTPALASSSSHSETLSPATSSSPVPPSSPPSNTKISAIIIGASTCAGALLFFAVVGLYVHVRRRRKFHKTQKEKVASTPYAFAYPRQLSGNLRRSPSLQIRLSKDTLQEVGPPQPTQLQPNRKPVALFNKGEHRPAQSLLTQDMRTSYYDSEVDSPKYGYARFGHAF